MTFTTLSYIHSLLTDDVEKRELQAKWNRELWLSEEEKDPNSTKALELNETYNKLRAEYNTAYDALQDFLTHEFR